MGRFRAQFRETSGQTGTTGPRHSAPPDSIRARRVSLFGMALLSGLLLALPAGAFEPLHLLGDGVQLHCEDAGDTRIRCDYRLLRPVPVTRVAASVGDFELPDATVKPRANPGGSVAVLFLVDTSDAERQPAIDKTIDHIGTIISAGKRHHRFGLAAFDNDLELMAAIGSSPLAVRARASQLKAEAPVTELYRTALEAIRMLAEVNATRRALVIMSDGLAEDRAYFHHDVVGAAREAGVVIYGVGYPRSLEDAVALQSLRRLAEETGGLYTGTGESFTLPAPFIGKFFASLDGGGLVTVDYGAALNGSTSGAPQLELEFIFAGGRATAALPLSIAPVAAAGAAGRPAAVPPAQPSPRAPSASTVWVWYVLLPVVLLGALAIFLLLNLRNRRREASNLTTTSPGNAPRTLAFLECQDGSGHRHAVTRAAYRIGRHSDNDLAIRDSSVSRQHAEIHVGDDGAVLRDPGGKNPLRVNGLDVNDHRLCNGDRICIGQTELVFECSNDGDDATPARRSLRVI